MTKNELFEKHIGLVHRIYNDKFTSMTSNVGIKDDIIQEGMLALWRACQNYDESRGVKFLTYAWKSIYNTMLCYASRYHKKTLCLVSIDTTVRDDGEGNMVAYADILATSDKDIEECDLKEIIERVLENMDSNARVVYNHIKDGYTQREVASMLHTTQPQIARTLKKFKILLKNSFTEDIQYDK